MLWPLFWSNSCCSHPREGEGYEFAANRRLKEELGLETSLHYLYKFKYQARYKDKGSEHELCSVFIGKTGDPPKINRTEIEDWKFFSKEELDRQLSETPEVFSPWFKMEWHELKTTFWKEIEKL